MIILFSSCMAVRHSIVYSEVIFLLNRPQDSRLSQHRVRLLPRLPFYSESLTIFKRYARIYLAGSTYYYRGENFVFICYYNLCHQ